MKSNRKRIPVWAKIVLVVLAVLLVVGVVGAGYAWSKLDKINKVEEVEKVEPEEEYFEPDEEEKGYEEINPEDVTWFSSEKYLEMTCVNFSSDWTRTDVPEKDEHVQTQ